MQFDWCDKLNAHFVGKNLPLESYLSFGHRVALYLYQSSKYKVWALNQTKELSPAAVLATEPPCFGEYCGDSVTDGGSK